MRERLSRVDRVTWVELAALGLLTYVVLWALHPDLLFSSTTANGGDMGAHVAMPAFLHEHLGFPWRFTPWYPGWFAGMPLYSYYFILPDALAALASFVIPATVAFKLATALGSLLMPLSAYVMGRLLQLTRPIPVMLAGAIVVFLFDGSYTIYGGNLFSTLAGEYAYSFSLSLAFITIGLFGRGIREGRGQWMTAVALSATLAAHILPWFYVLATAVVMLAIEWVMRPDDPVAIPRGHKRRATAFVIVAGCISATLSAWWAVPFTFTQELTNSMGYTNFDTSSLHTVFTNLGWFSEAGGSGPLRPVIVIAGLGLLWSFAVRSRGGILLSLMSVVSLSAYIAMPQGALWNGRVIPYWYISVYLTAAWFLGSVVVWIAERRHDRRLIIWHRWQQIYEAEGMVEELSAPPSPRQRIWSPVVIALVATLLVVAPNSPSLARVVRVTPAVNQVPSWSSWNYSGYESKPAWPEYHTIMTTMQNQAAQHGCGRAYWEYAPDQDRFGTPMALMLLPYWTNNCVDSMEGLTFESSPTVPYHFMVQSELSVTPSRPMVGLPYQPVNTTMGVQHLQMLGVKYFLAFSPAIVASADQNPALLPLTVIPKLGDRGVAWHVYLVKDAPLVTGLPTLPNVVLDTTSRTDWLSANEYWWNTPSAWSVLGASHGPGNWPRVNAMTAMRRVSAPAVTVSNITTTSSSISFHVSRVGTPVLVRISYYPRWRADGAQGPYRVSPNFMVVVPTTKDVTLTYGSSSATTIGGAITLLALMRGGVLLVRRLRRRPRF